MDWFAVAHWAGITIMITAVALSNIAVKKMAEFVNSKRSGLGKVHWEIRNDNANREVIRRYRTSNPGGPLFRNFLLACGLFVAGIVIMFLKELLSSIVLTGR